MLHGLRPFCNRLPLTQNAPILVGCTRLAGTNSLVDVHVCRRLLARIRSALGFENQAGGLIWFDVAEIRTECVKSVSGGDGNRYKQ